MKVNAEHGCVAESVRPSTGTHSPRGFCVHRQVIFIRPDTFVHDERFAHGSGVTPSVVDDAMRLGNTLLVHNLEIYWKPVGECRECVQLHSYLQAVLWCVAEPACAGILSEHLSSFMNLYAQVNLYFSPPGFASTVCPHQDAQVRAGSPSLLTYNALCLKTLRLDRASSSCSWKARKPGTYMHRSIS